MPLDIPESAYTGNTAESSGQVRNEVWRLLRWDGADVLMTESSHQDVSYSFLLGALMDVATAQSCRVTLRRSCDSVVKAFDSRSVRSGLT